MSTKLSRKRSRVTLDSDEDETQQLRQPSPALSSRSDTLKRSRTQCELDELDIIEPKDAWTVDISAILASPALATPPDSGFKPHNNWQRYKRGQCITVLCVQGNLQLHYNLLCSALDELYSVSPSLQAIVLCHDPSTHKPSTIAPFSLPLISAVDPPNNHFVRLGLLHPLGGGKFPLDALAVIDRKGRRRLVLPFGWGAGKHADTPAGKSIQTKMMMLLKHCIETLEKEA
ncbi:uncharacterized protein M421DRAFT_4075 [Didymella exigua CBS 183.55]|uniref:Uncharacterized protein n=1 Tax=Didymella exigua CBS 183.55 TaxID=1150837 RepID=A0A6A5RQA5_9PLEO|nr:uncharacterized protein M421DRAFT_4075 [Didymella exigua CBS 183.55]KAF1929613.1 hypothetical protein M421DRAFT_4075 [Didymella exigua CBS 183.55]